MAAKARLFKQSNHTDLQDQRVRYAFLNFSHTLEDAETKIRAFYIWSERHHEIIWAALESARPDDAGSAGAGALSESLRQSLREKYTQIVASSYGRLPDTSLAQLANLEAKLRQLSIGDNTTPRTTADLYSELDRSEYALLWADTATRLIVLIRTEVLIPIASRGVNGKPVSSQVRKQVSTIIDHIERLASNLNRV